MTRLSSDYERWAARQDMDEAQNEILKLEATNAALVEALEAAVEVMEFAYMNAPKQPGEIAKARAALKLAKGE